MKSKWLEILKCAIGKTVLMMAILLGIGALLIGDVFLWIKIFGSGGGAALAWIITHLVTLVFLIAFFDCKAELDDD